MQCPICKSKIVEEEKLFKCEKQSSAKNENGEWQETGTCSYKVFKSCLAKMNGPYITESILAPVLNGEETILEFTSKAGKPYSAPVIVDPRWGLKVVFRENNN